MKTHSGAEGRDADPTRRALLHAGWIVPAIIAVKVPTDAFAQYSTSVGVEASVGVTAGPVTVGGSVSGGATLP